LPDPAAQACTGAGGVREPTCADWVHRECGDYPGSRSSRACDRAALHLWRSSSMRDRSHSSQPYAGLRLLAVHAHPDDEASKGAATSAKYAALGARVMVLTMTGGEAGDILNPALEQTPAAVRDIAGLRRDEMAEAARLLGIEHAWAGYVDSGLPDGDPDELTPRGSFYR